MEKENYLKTYLVSVLIIFVGIAVYLLLGFDPYLERPNLSHTPPYEVLRNQPWKELFYNTPISFGLTSVMIVIIKIKDIFFSAFADEKMVPIIGTYVFDTINFILLFITLAVVVKTLKDLKVEKVKIYLAVIYIFFNPVAFGFLFDPFYHIWTYYFLTMTMLFLAHGCLCNKPSSLVLSILALILTFLSHNMYSIVIVLAYSGGIIILFNKFKSKHYIAITVILLIPLVMTIKTYFFHGTLATNSATYLHIMVYPNFPEDIEKQLIKEEKITSAFSQIPYALVPKKEIENYVKKYQKDFFEGQYEDDKYILKHYPQYYLKTVQRSYIYYFMPITLFHQFTYCCTKSKKVLYKVNPLIQTLNDKKVNFWPVRGIKDTKFSLTIILLYIVLLFYAICSLFDVRDKKKFTGTLSVGALMLSSGVILKFINPEIFINIFIFLFFSGFLLFLAGLTRLVLMRYKKISITAKNTIFGLSLGMIFYITFVGTMVTFGENMRFRMGADIFLLPLLISFLIDLKNFYKNKKNFNYEN